jgi:hypothetical protein
MLHAGVTVYSSGPATAPQRIDADASGSRYSLESDEHEVQRADQHEAAVHQRRERVDQKVADERGGDAHDPVGEGEAEKIGHALFERQLGNAAHAHRPVGHHQHLRGEIKLPWPVARLAHQRQERDRHRQERGRARERHLQHDELPRQRPDGGDGDERRPERELAGFRQRGETEIAGGEHRRGHAGGDARAAPERRAPGGIAVQREAGAFGQVNLRLSKCKPGKSRAPSSAGRRRAKASRQ